MEGGLSVTGAPRDMHPVVRDEIYRMAYEAIRNACRHSGGTRLDVELIYGPDLVVRVAAHRAPPTSVRRGCPSGSSR